MASSLGRRLRDARQRQEGDLSLIAAQLRIGAQYLAAIEEDDLSKLPGGFFTRSFYRQYAIYLGIGESEIQLELDRLMSRENAPLLPGQGPRKEGSDLPPLPSYAERPRSARRVVTAVAALVGVVAGCGFVYQFWFSGDRGSVLGSAPESAVTSSSDAHPSAGLAPVAAAATEDSDAPLRLEIEADEEVWVQITAGGERVFQGLLQRSESKQLTGLENARLLVGNAGGIRIYWNGKSIGPIGERGEVRLVRLTPEGPEVTNPRDAPPASEDGNASSTQS
jgi:hypothetical protein